MDELIKSEIQVFKGRVRLEYLSLGIKISENRYMLMLIIVSSIFAYTVFVVSQFLMTPSILEERSYQFAIGRALLLFFGFALFCQVQVRSDKKEQELFDRFLRETQFGSDKDRLEVYEEFLEYKQKKSSG